MQVVEQIQGGFVAKEVVEAVEVEVWKCQRYLLGFEDIVGGIVNALDMAKEAYFLGYTLSILVAKVELAQLYLAKVAKALGNSVVESKYYMVHIVVAQILVELVVFIAMIFTVWIVKVD